MNSLQWFAMMDLYDEMPGSTHFLPPEKPAKKWDSMKPWASSRSASTATRLTMHSPPDGSVPIFTMDASSVETCITICSRSTISRPYLSINSSRVEGR